MVLKKWEDGCRFLCALALAVFTAWAPVAEAKELVLLDSDMTEMFDDGVSMIMLERSPDIDLLGVTIVTGNTWTEDGTAFAIRQLEGLGVRDVPVAMGEPKPEIVERSGHIDEENHTFGRGHDIYSGAMEYARPKDWQTAYRHNYGVAPTLAPLEEAAEDMIIRVIKEHPGEVTVVAIGPCTNIAKAIEKAPEIVPMAKRIAYMGGAFFQQGNVTPAAEFNIWIDPTSAKQVMRAPWREQIIVPLDACEKIQMTKEDFSAFTGFIRKTEFRQMMERHYLAEYLETGTPTFVWDVLTVALLIDPSVITEEVTMPVDVNDVWSPSYGQTLAYVTVQPEGTQKARIVKSMDQCKIFAMLTRVFKTL